MKKIKAWAITCPFCEEDGKMVCRHEKTLSIYRTLKHAQADFLAKDGLPKCTHDEITPVLISFPKTLRRAAKRKNK